ncbi:MAG: response regulator [Candidatus Aminicenantes bacterium]|nr:response regulator [Candidatus Aminicenantes bacterium]
MTRDISLKLLLVTSFLVIGMIPVMTFALISLHTSDIEFRNQAFQHLESVRNIKKHQIENFFSERLRDVTVLSGNPYVVSAFRDLRQAFYDNGDKENRGFQGHTRGRFKAPSPYRRVHDRHFFHFQKMAREYGYYDIFLMTPEKGHTVFTLRKESDFGIPIGDNPSSLRDVWRQTRDKQTVALSDTKPYPPSMNAPAQFMAAPIRDGRRTIGILALQISIESIDHIMQERTGMWETSDTYLVGQDLRMRSDSYMDRNRHSVQASLNGTVRENGVDTPPSRAALAGKAGRIITRNYRGARVLSAYTPIEILGVKWALIAEIEQKEIDAQIARALNTPLITLFILSGTILLLLSWIVSSFLNRGLKRTTGQLNKMITKILAGDLNSRGDVDSVSRDFREVVDSANQLIEAYAQQSRKNEQLVEHIQYSQRMKAIGTLAGGIAHDFNNILTSLFAYAYIVRAEVNEDGPARQGIAEIVSGLRRASEVVDQILVFGQSLKSKKKSVEITGLVSEAVKLVKAIMPKNITLTLDVIPETRYVLAVPAQINQILMNLCTNAIDAIGDQDGNLVISVSAFRHDGRQISSLDRGEFCRITVMDDGRGMPPGIQTRIFEPFFTTKPIGSGSGMGLSMVHGIVTDNGGEVEVTSTPGKGSRLDVYLPLIDPDQWSAEVEESPRVLSGQGEKILFVDDEIDICLSHKHALESRGFKVSAISDSRRARDLLNRKTQAFDLVITDLNMPHVNGIEIATLASRHLESRPVIIITGFQQDPAQLKPVENLENIAGILKKPYEMNQLIAMIHDALKDNPAAQSK